MRYKQDLAEFVSIADSARFVQERAGISEDEAREDIVAAVRDLALKVRWWNAIRNQRRQYYVCDLPHGFLANLTPDLINWENSVARRRGVGDSFKVEVEVSRDDICRLWPNKSITPPDGADKTKTPQRPGRPSAPEASIKEAFEELIESKDANLETITANYSPIRAKVKSKLRLKSTDEIKGLGDETIRKIIKPLIEKAKNGGKLSPLIVP